MTVFVWLDLETTGLDVDNCQIIEAAAIITNERFEPLEEYHAVINPGGKLSYEEGAYGFHKRSGLVDEVSSGKPLRQVEEELLSLIMRYEPHKKRAYLAGNSVHFDRKFLTKFMPQVVNHLTHRHLDVSAVGVLMRAVFGKEEAEYRAPRPHRASDDLHRSLAELQFYLDNFIFPDN
jgi:oligoribonuclease